MITFFPIGCSPPCWIVTWSIPALYYTFGPTLTHPCIGTKNAKTKIKAKIQGTEAGSKLVFPTYASCAPKAEMSGFPPAMCGRELTSILQILIFEEGRSSWIFEMNVLPQNWFEDLPLRRPPGTHYHVRPEWAAFSFFMNMAILPFFPK